VTRNNNTGPSRSGNWNEYNLNPLTRNNWRASLVPAAAVIPAPIAYINIAAVKKLVVGFLACHAWPATLRGECRVVAAILPESVSTLHWAGHRIWIFYFEKIRVFKAGFCNEYISME
jgi:hypothetical protein